METRHRSSSSSSTTTLSPSNSMLVPYAARHRNRQLALVPYSRFALPRGWGVEEVPRADGTRSDTYYYEPGTGRKFRSTREVQRYLNGEGYPFRAKRISSLRNHISGYNRMLLSSGERTYECRRMIVSGGKLFMLDNNVNPTDFESGRSTAPPAPYILPNGWIVEEVPRRYNSNWIDKYYYEPGTGQKFRSLAAVEKYLLESEENAPLSKALEEIKENKPLSKFFKLENHLKTYALRKKNTTGENTQDSSFISPPVKVNWVLASSRGDTWNPFIAETLVPDPVKQQWNDRLMILMNDENK